MDSASERACPSCSASARPDQRWCLDCGAELPQRSKRSGLRPAIGIATTLAVLVGAGSAGGYTLLQDGKKPPPPALTVAQEPPPAATPPPADDATLPPADDYELPDTTADDAYDVPDDGAASGDGDGGATAPADDAIPDLSDDVDDSTPNPPPPDDAAPDVDDDGSGRVEDGGSKKQRRAARPSKPRLRETNIALGAVAVVFAPQPSDEDLGDASAIADGSSRTAWRTPRFDDPALPPEIGVYVDLAAAERLTKLVVSSPTPGLAVEIYGASSGPPKSVTAPGWTRVAETTLAARSTVQLPAGSRYRFVLLWITGLPAGADQGAISELQIFSKQPE